MANFIHAILLRWLNLWALAGIIGTSALGMLWGAHHFGTFNLGWTISSFGFGLFRVGFGFFGGVLLYRTRATWASRIPQIHIGVLFAGLLALGNLPKSFINDGWPFLAADYLSMLVVFPALVMLGSVAKGGRLCAILGTLSFPLYAIHKPIVEALEGFHMGDLVSCFAVLVLVLVSWGIGRWIDEPLNDWRRGRRAANRRSVEQVQAV